jgi:hypothetical protein
MKRIIIFGAIICLSLAILTGKTLSQQRIRNGPSDRFYKGIRDSKNYSGISSSTRRQVTDETKEKSVKGAVGANDEQWKLIKPKLEKVKKLRRQACMVINTAGGGSGGSRRSNIPQRAGATGPRPQGGAASGGAFIEGEEIGGSSSRTNKDGTSGWMQWKWAKGWDKKDEQRKDQKICYELFHLLHNKNASLSEIRQKMDRLRIARQETKKKSAEAQEQLRRVLTLDQQARLVALGWLD